MTIFCTKYIQSVSCRVPIGPIQTKIKFSQQTLVKPFNNKFNNSPFRSFADGTRRANGYYLPITHSFHVRELHAFRVFHSQGEY